MMVRSPKICWCLLEPRSAGSAGAGGGVVGGRGVGGATAPPKFWVGENPGSILQNLGKILWNPVKISENRRRFLNKKILEKLSENLSKNDAEHFYLKIVALKLRWKVFLVVMLFGVISGRFGEIWAKIFRTPKTLPAPTPMAGNIRTLLRCVSRGDWRKLLHWGTFHKLHEQGEFH